MLNEEEKIELNNEPMVEDEVKEETITDGEGTKEIEEEPTIKEPEPTVEEGTRTLEGTEEKMIPQSEVNKLVGTTRQEAREKARAELREELRKELMAEFFEKFGVNDETELDNVFGKGQQYDILNEDFTRQGSDLEAMREENVLLKSEVIPDNWEDSKLILNIQAIISHKNTLLI